MSKEIRDVRMCVHVGIVVAVEANSDDDATLIADKMFERGELTDRILVAVHEGNISYDIDGVEVVDEV